VGFLLVSARVTGAVYFVPIPGMDQGSRFAKMILVIAISGSLFAYWPTPDPQKAILGMLITGLLKEAVIGICLGLVVSLTTELFSFCFHLVGLQAGFTFASTIDPTSKADVTVLESLGHLAAGMLFFTMGLHRSVIRAFAVSLQSHPAGSWALGPGAIEPVIRLFQSMFSAGIRLALPVLASMLMIDISLALLGRVSSHLQLMFLAFPVKMLASLLLISWIVMILPNVFGEFAQQVLTVVQRLVL
jgi:flagellar biosynthetic protein FliR